MQHARSCRTSSVLEIMIDTNNTITYINNAQQRASTTTTATQYTKLSTQKYNNGNYKTVMRAAHIGLF